MSVSPSSHHPHPPAHERTVTVTFDGSTKEVAPGAYTGATIKSWFGLGAGVVLDYKHGNHLKPLPDDGTIEIKHDIEVFACPVVGTSS